MPCHLLSVGGFDGLFDRAASLNQPISRRKNHHAREHLVVVLTGQETEHAIRNAREERTSQRHRIDPSSSSLLAVLGFLLAAPLSDVVVSI